MSMRSILFGFLVLLTGGFWVAATIAEPPDAKQENSKNTPKDAASTFEALKKQLPDIVSAWCESSAILKPKIRIARRTSVEEAKITFEGIAALTEDSECFFTLYLRYYEGAWTVMRWEAGGNEIHPERIKGYMLKLGLTIDKATGR
jgi:hypothetical protein